MPEKKPSNESEKKPSFSDSKKQENANDLKDGKLLLSMLREMYPKLKDHYAGGTLLNTAIRDREITFSDRKLVQLALDDEEEAIRDERKKRQKQKKDEEEKREKKQKEMDQVREAQRLENLREMPKALEIFDRVFVSAPPRQNFKTPRETRNNWLERCKVFTAARKAVIEAFPGNVDLWWELDRVRWIEKEPDFEVDEPGPGGDFMRPKY